MAADKNSAIKATSISAKVVNGKPSTTSTDHTEPSKEKHPMKNSERGYKLSQPMSR
jgi:hypothetical protein